MNQVHDFFKEQKERVHNLRYEELVIFEAAMEEVADIADKIDRTAEGDISYIHKESESFLISVENQMHEASATASYLSNLAAEIMKEMDEQIAENEAHEKYLSDTRFADKV